MFDFIIPVYRTTRRVKKGFREMQEKMQQHAGQYNEANTPKQNSTGNSVAGDYIEFEEVKNN